MISFFFLVTNDRWMNLPWTDPAIISFGTKLDSISSQWSRTTQSQGSSGNQRAPTVNCWPQQPSTQSQGHMISNGIYVPYSTTKSVNNGNRS